MVPFVVGTSAAETAARLARARAMFPRLPEDEAGWRAVGFLYGSPETVVADLRAWEALGVDRVMLQLLDQDDSELVRLLAREVVPAFR
jgi:alkanesulfonate monooxygenase SsuD/methylene tetrahydromethanopterin reductase-like flavin-dependent oxidoreductase (luciferase family)